MFSLNYGTEKSVDILTDIYLERDSFSHGIRYALSVFSPVRSKQLANTSNEEQLYIISPNN
jgi:hypothetical protein